MHVLTFGVGDAAEAYYIYSHNPWYIQDRPAQFSLFRYCSIIVDDDPVDWTVTDWQLYQDDSIGRKAIVGVGYRNDSAWAFRLVPEVDSIPTQSILLNVGKAGGRDDRWEPAMYITMVKDYDCDGIDEAIVVVQSVRDDDTRFLHAIELETMRPEWSLPMAALPLTDKNCLDCGDADSPRIIVATGNPEQGRSDARFHDRYAYLAVIRVDGEVVHQQVAAVRPMALFVVPAPSVGEFFFAHECDLEDPGNVNGLTDHEAILSLDTSTYRISRINCEGEVLARATVGGKPRDMWLIESHLTGGAALFVTRHDDSVLVFDTALSLVAAGHAPKLGRFIGEISVKRHKGALVFSDGLYSSSFDKLAYWPFQTVLVEPLVYDSGGFVKTLILSSSDRHAVGDIDRRSLVELIVILYVNNKEYVLAALSGLLVALLVVNYYRRRTRAHLRLISRQKRELEKAHQALKEAQEKLVEHEKYRTAKDVAGGLAHEIRNALFPVEVTLSMLTGSGRKLSTNQDQLRERHVEIGKAVARVIEMTRLISRYTKLDAERSEEPVNAAAVMREVLKANEPGLEQARVQVHCDLPDEVMVISNSAQLYTVFSNLLLNSLDALTKTPDPRIVIEYIPQGEFSAISVADNGCGIPDDELERVFDAFYTTKPDTGTGLGLSMVRKIVELYEGSVSVSSEPGHGTTFHVRLRLSKT